MTKTVMKPKKGTKYQEWLLKIKTGGNQCSKCGENRSHLLTVEHIVPVNLIKQFHIFEENFRVEYDFEENFEILCRYCNGMKMGMIDIKHPKTIPVLEFLIKKAKEIYNI